jgi:hypothetical protein
VGPCPLQRKRAHASPLARICSDHPLHPFICHPPSTLYPPPGAPDCPVPRHRRPTLPCPRLGVVGTRRGGAIGTAAAVVVVVAALPPYRSPSVGRIDASCDGGIPVISPSLAPAAPVRSPAHPGRAATSVIFPSAIGMTEPSTPALRGASSPMDERRRRGSHGRAPPVEDREGGEQRPAADLRT